MSFARCLVFLVCGVFSQCAPRSQKSQLNSHLANGEPIPFTPAHWMEALSSKIAEKPLNQIFIPGSHDAGTYSISSHSQACPGDLDEGLHHLTQTSISNEIVARLSLTQTEDVMSQLHAGVRFFDLRVCKFQNDYWISHGLVAYPLRNFLEGIRAFTESFEKEIVILEIGRFFNFEKEDHSNLQKEIKDLLDPHIANASLNPRSPLKDFWSNGKNIVIIYEDRSPFWVSSRLNNAWPNTESVDAVLEIGLKRNATAKMNNTLRVFQAVVNHSKEAIMAHKTIRANELSQGINSVVSHNLETLKQERVNIILFDDVTSGTLSQDIIQLNKD